MTEEIITSAIEAVIEQLQRQPDNIQVLEQLELLRSELDQIRGK